MLASKPSSRTGCQICRPLFLSVCTTYSHAQGRPPLRFRCLRHARRRAPGRRGSVRRDHPAGDREPHRTSGRHRCGLRHSRPAARQEVRLVQLLRPGTRPGGPSAKARHALEARTTGARALGHVHRADGRGAVAAAGNRRRQMSATPPRIARAIVSLATDSDDRRWLLADLDEEFGALTGSDPGHARRWYWRQAITSLFPLVRRRLQRRPPSTAPARPVMFNGFRTELRHAVRSALRTPAPTAAILLTLALGIGATAAVSTVVWKVLLQPLPVRDPARVLAVYRQVVGT